MASSSESTSHSENIDNTPDSSIETVFRFPTAVIDYRVGDLIQQEITESMTLPGNRSNEAHHAADDMTPRSESPSDFDEPGYEMIDTDVDSRDDAATESIASTDCGRSDDVASLADTEEQSEDDASVGHEDHEDHERDAFNGIPDYEGLDEPSETPTLHHSVNAFIGGLEKPLVRSIEFEEPADICAENVAVKHTIADFSEERSKQIIEDMKLKTESKHLMATIHQTMTKQGLSTKEPLRILYVGSHSAKQDIIHKIASSVTASIKGESNIRKPSSQVYNVVPVSAFGSDETPEIELMHSSGYQIQVEDCLCVTQEKGAAFPGFPTAITLHIDGNSPYTSLPDKSRRSGYEIFPSGCVRPHIAVLYCSDIDTQDQRRDIALARTFMNRHSIPSIVISHRQTFDKSVPPMVLDQHAIHMCLESRDPQSSGNIVLRRLPIDLASFLNLDARQMNRNLAYITGLCEKARPTVPIQSRPKIPQRRGCIYTAEKPHSLREQVYDTLEFIMTPIRLVPIAAFILLLGVHSMGGLDVFMRPFAAPSVSINGRALDQATVPIIMSSSASSSMATSAATSQSTASTRTKTITIVESKLAGPNSLIPFVDFKKFTETVQNFASPPAVEKPASWTAEAVDDNKILLRSPIDIKLNWISKGEMSINIARASGRSIQIYHTSSTSSGLCIQIPKQEAYGLFNIYVTKKNKPTINEAFQVDFGYNTKNVFGKVASLIRQDVLDLENALYNTCANVNNQTRQISHQALIQWKNLQQITVGAKQQVANHSATAGGYLASFAKAKSLDLARHGAILTREVSHRLSETNKAINLQKARSAIDEALFKAQVGSKLYWLRLQGKKDEHESYKAKAMAAQKKLMRERERTRKLDRKGRRAEWKAKREVRREERKVRKGYA